jgi:predicted Zn-dependent protease with MMP-like domain
MATPEHPTQPREPTDPLDAIVEAAVFRALDRLPPAFAERLGSVAIVVEDEPTPAQLASVGAGGLYGLYQGVPRTAFAADTVPIPSKITIFRGPLARAHRDPDALGRAVEETVFHEIAHHFGIGDARLNELKRRP